MMSMTSVMLRRVRVERKRKWREGDNLLSVSVHDAFGFGAFTMNDFAQARERDDGGRGRVAFGYGVCVCERESELCIACLRYCQCHWSCWDEERETERE